MTKRQSLALNKEGKRMEPQDKNENAEHGRG